MPLTDLSLRVRYTPNTCPHLVQELYNPLLAEAVSYDRTTYTFSSRGLIAAAAGTQAFIDNGGRIRLICDHSVKESTLTAIFLGQTDPEEMLRRELQAHDVLDEEKRSYNPGEKSHLQLTKWLVAHGIMEVKVAIHGEQGEHPFHIKTGTVTDQTGNKIAFSGSLNETLSGWERNYEHLDVYSDQEPREKERIQEIEAEFEQLWSDQAEGVKVISLPDYYRDYIRETTPGSPPQVFITPRRLIPDPSTEKKEAAQRYWENIYQALAEDPASTAALLPSTLWPHQEEFRQRNVPIQPLRCLIADEVGLGKTLEAGVVLKTRLNQAKYGKYLPANTTGNTDNEEASASPPRPHRALIITPKAALRQWQSELLMKFAINAPIIDTQGRHYRNGNSLPAATPPWDAPLALASHQWLVRHSKDFLAWTKQESHGGDSTEHPCYDLVIVDEAHRARFEEVDNEQRRRPNKYLQLLQGLARQTRELILLTATPMQLNEVELWALLELLEPDGWRKEQYRRFHQANGTQDNPTPTLAEWKEKRQLWQQARASRNSTTTESAIKRHSLLSTDNDVLLAQLLKDAKQVAAAQAVMEQDAPARQLLHRQTRELLRQYQREGLMKAPIPHRKVTDIPIEMNQEELQLYRQIPQLIQGIYGNRKINRNALGFINTVFRKRIGSSLYAYAKTLENVAQRDQDQRYTAFRESPEQTHDWAGILDEMDQDDPQGQSETLAHQAIEAINQAVNQDDLKDAARAAHRLSHQDTKYSQLTRSLRELQADQHDRILIFTQFKDTQDFLASRLRRQEEYQVTTLHGGDGTPQERANKLKAFQEQPQGILLCTETASESLNLQFCSALVNYDIPWNPMTLEQRAGRIDRIGQLAPVVEVVNLFYQDSVEYDAYQAVKNRFKDIRTNVGEYPPILANGILEIIKQEKTGGASRDQALNDLEQRAAAQFDLNRLNTQVKETVDAALAWISPADLEKPLRQPELMPPSWTVENAGGRHWHVTPPGGQTVTVTTDPLAYEQATGRLVWWEGPKVLETN